MRNNGLGGTPKAASVPRLPGFRDRVSGRTSPCALCKTGGCVCAAPAGGERRQLTVMFCDLVGSTALSEKLDPEELRSLLHAYRNLCGDVIARYDGFVARYVGDGILTYFGWPTAHEEDAERAVRAALEIVQTVKRASSTEDLSVRIGIATGPVVVGEPAGTGDERRPNVVGWNWPRPVCRRLRGKRCRNGLAKRCR